MAIGQAQIYAIPKEPTTPKPIFKSNRDFEKLAIQPSTLNLAASATVSHRNLEFVSDQDVYNSEESLYCDNITFLPDVETDNCKGVVSVFAWRLNKPAQEPAGPKPG